MLRRLISAMAKTAAGNRLTMKVIYPYLLAQADSMANAWLSGSGVRAGAVGAIASRTAGRTFHVGQ
jgi:hypothetical protein